LFRDKDKYKLKRLVSRSPYADTIGYLQIYIILRAIHIPPMERLWYFRETYERLTQLVQPMFVQQYLWFCFNIVWKRCILRRIQFTAVMHRLKTWQTTYLRKQD